MFGYSLSINDGVPNKEFIYDELKKIVVNIKMYSFNNDTFLYDAITVAGLEGFLVLNHLQSKQMASYLQDYGVI